MKDERKTKKQLIDELTQLRQQLSQERCRVNELEARDQDDAVRQQMEEMLRASMEQWHTIFNAMSNAICLLDSQGRIRRCNRAMVELLDKPLGEILGRHCWEVMHGTSESIDECPLVRMWASLSRESLTMPFGNRWFDVFVAPLLADDGQSVGAIHVMTDITERKRAEEALREAELRYRTVADFTYDWEYWENPDGTFRYVSPSCERITGYASERFMDEPGLLSQIILPEDREIWAEYRHAIVETPGLYEIQFRIRRHDGEIRWIEHACKPVTDQQEAFLGYRGSNREITDRKQAERELQQSNDILRAIIEAAPTAIIGLDLDGNVQTVWNPAAEKMLGWSAQEIMGHPLPSVPEESQEEFGRFRERIRSGKTLDGVEVRRQRRDGSPIDYSIYASPLHDAESQIIGNIAVLVDITERLRSEEERAQAEEQIRFQATLLNAVGQAVIATDLDGTIVYLNRAAEKLYGWPVAEALGRNIVDVTIPEISQDEAVEIMERLSVGQSWSGEFLARRRDGTTFPALVYDTPVPDITGKLIGIVGVSSDITERKRAEEALAEQTRQLRVLSARLAETQEVERYRIARELHDQVGQGLTAMGINLNVLRPHLAQAPQAAQSCLDDLLAQVKETTSHIRCVIANLRPPELDDYGLLAALRWYADQIGTRVGLDVSVAGETIHPRLSLQQETALFRIAQEALTNVVKHAQATQITVAVETDEESLCMTIVDDGVGFDSASSEEAGATRHWGLLTMKERAQAIGARWRIESSPDEGTRVIVEMVR